MYYSARQHALRLLFHGDYLYIYDSDMLDFDSMGGIESLDDSHIIYLYTCMYIYIYVYMCICVLLCAAARPAAVVSLR